MRRNVDRSSRARRPRVGGSTALGLALLAPAGAVAGDGPELSPPSEMVIISKPANPAPAPVPPVVKPSTPGRAVLAIPGLTTPANRPATNPPAPKPAAEPAPGELMLDAPIEMRPLAEAPPNGPAASPSRSSLPLILDPSPTDEPGPTARSTPSTRKPTTPPQPASTPARRPRLFGFLAGPAAAPTPPPSTSTSTSSRTSTPGRAVVGEDPAVESALKRRIERQAREVVGNRARSVEVKLDGKDAVVQVSGVKMFQKRAVRKQLEGIPALSGLRSTIEVID